MFLSTHLTSSFAFRLTTHRLRAFRAMANDVTTIATTQDSHPELSTNSDEAIIRRKRKLFNENNCI
ncbi:protein of unknown function [Stenotrophomonas maltophilia]|nr:protein of unknown function [Stenotrophomonas maltophilia]